MPDLALSGNMRTKICIKTSERDIDFYRGYTTSPFAQPKKKNFLQDRKQKRVGKVKGESIRAI